MLNFIERRDTQYNLKDFLIIPGYSVAGPAATCLLQQSSWPWCGSKPVRAVTVTKTRKNHQDRRPREFSKSAPPSFLGMLQPKYHQIFLIQETIIREN